MYRLFDTLLVPAPKIKTHTSEVSWVNFSNFLTISLQLGVLVLVIQEFKLISPAFYYYVTLATFYGFIIHHLLPLRLRLPFFLAISLVTILLVLGATDGTGIILMGLSLIGACHLPIPFLWRSVLVFLMGAGFAALRLGWYQSPWSNAVWPVLGSMFMFRLIIYLYDLSHQKEKTNIIQSLSYFFLLPNVAFPLFPVVDYTTFRKKYFDENEFQIYRKGIKWIFRGVIQLLLYRIVNHYFVISPTDVTNFAEFARYVVSNFLLYLRLSGQFHLVIGMLHLFGFNLPETHNMYYLASSFLDFWRRINIYWKDFMQKIFFMPCYFKVKKLGAVNALIISTIYVFFATWVLHAVQWFWIRGSFLLTGPDIAFWTILCVLVIFNSIYEHKQGRKRSLGKQSMNFRSIASRSVSVVLTFTTISLLWSLWTSPSMSAWFGMLEAGLNFF